MGLRKPEDSCIGNSNLKGRVMAVLVSALLVFLLLFSPASVLAADDSSMKEKVKVLTSELTEEQENIAREALENKDPEFYKYYELDDDGNIMLKGRDSPVKRASGISSATVPSKYSTAAGYTKYRAIDVSYHQGSINWKKVKNAGITHAYIRVAYRGYGDAGNIVLDSRYKENIKEAYDNGIKVGVYFYSQAVTASEAKKEASVTLDCINEFKNSIKLQVVYDFEYSQGRLNRSTFSNSERVSAQTKLCEAFCDKIKDGGYTPMIYANKSTLMNDLDYNSLQDKYKIWLAHYTSGAATDYPGEYYAWQYSSTGSVSGIDGNVDMEYIFKKESETYFLVSSDSGYRVKSSSGNYVKSAWIKIDGKYYYTGSDGYCVEGLCKIAGKYYWFGSNCAAKENAWVTSGSKKYYCGTKGLIYTGYKKVGNYYYYFDSSGVMQKDGTKTFGGKKYKLLSNGKSCIYKVVTTDKLNMRKSDSSSAEVKGTVAKGKSKYILRTSSGYAQLSNGYWVSLSYLKVTYGYPYKKVSYKVKTTDNLNIRTGPSSTAFKKVGMYKKGKTVKIVQETGSWGKVADGKWMCLTYTVKK